MQAPEPRRMNWLSVSALVIAIVALLVGPVTAIIVPGPTGISGAQGPAGPAGPRGPQGLAGSGFDSGFVWGYALISSCTNSPAVTTFEIDYINLGNVTALNVVAQYTVLTHNNPTTSFSGTVSIGNVPRLTSGATPQSVSIGCGFNGSSVDVYFTWG